MQDIFIFHSYLFTDHTNIILKHAHVHVQSSYEALSIKLSYFPYLFAPAAA